MSSSSQVAPSSSSSSSASSAGGLMDTAKNMFASIMSAGEDNRSIVIFTIITLFVIIGIIGFIIYRMSRSDLSSTMLISDPKKIYDQQATGPTVVDGGKMPATINGQEFTYSMWIYVTEFVTTENHKLIYMRGGTASSVAAANPIIYMDGKTNKLYISVRTNLSKTSAAGTLADVADRRKSSYMTATIDYLPLQRWVNVTFVVRDNLLTVYMDGDIYTAENVADFKTPSNTRPVFSGTKGSVILGSIPGTSEVRGFVSRLAFFNYGLSHRDVKTTFAAGPVSMGHGLLARMGLPEYALRSPIYRAGEEEEKKAMRA